MAIAYSPDNRLIAAADSLGSIAIWDIASSKPLRLIHGDGDELRQLSFAPDGTTLAAAGSTGTIRLWDPITGQELLSLPAHREDQRIGIFAGRLDAGLRRPRRHRPPLARRAVAARARIPHNRISAAERHAILVQLPGTRENQPTTNVLPSPRGQMPPDNRISLVDTCRRGGSAENVLTEFDEMAFRTS